LSTAAISDAATVAASSNSPITVATECVMLLL
jgi:hypothetical protein